MHNKLPISNECTRYVVAKPTQDCAQLMEITIHFYVPDHLALLQSTQVNFHRVWNLYIYVYEPNLATSNNNVVLHWALIFSKLTVLFVVVVVTNLFLAYEKHNQYRNFTILYIEVDSLLKITFSRKPIDVSIIIAFIASECDWNFLIIDCNVLWPILKQWLIESLDKSFQRLHQIAMIIGNFIQNSIEFVHWE